MTQPMTIPAPAGNRRVTRSPIRSSAERFAGRWSATEQLIADRRAEPRSQSVAAAQGPGNSAAPAHTDAEARQRQNSDVAAAGIDDLETVLRDDGGIERSADRQQIPAEPRARFVEHLAAITEQFTNPSTGETSVDRPLTISDQREADYEHDTPIHHHSQTGPRL